MPQPVFIALLLSFGILFGGSALQAQDFSRTDPNGKLSDHPAALLEFKGASPKGDYLVLTYSIPYQGMVEFRLFDDQEALVWRKQEVRESGEHQLVLRRSAFREGISYQCRFNYKEDEVSETLLVP